MNIEISKDLTEPCEVSYIRYQCNLNEQRKIHEEEKFRKKICEEEEPKNELIREKPVFIKIMKIVQTKEILN